MKAGPSFPTVGWGSLTAASLGALLFFAYHAEGQQAPVRACLCPCVQVDAACQAGGEIDIHAVELHEKALQYLRQQAPSEIKLIAGGIDEWSASGLAAAFSEAFKAARCHSGGAAGPDNPGSISAISVKAWVEQVAKEQLPLLAPLIGKMDAIDVCNIWRRAVEIKRRKPFNYYGECKR